MTQSRQRPGLIWAAAALLLLGACATPQTDQVLTEGRKNLPAQAAIPDVPFFPQERLYCGPAALAMALAWSGLDVTQDDVAPLVYTPGREGTLPADLLAGARRYGRLAVPVTTMNDLVAEIAAGHPVVVFQNLALDWFPNWHFAVATGYDLDKNILMLHSGEIADHTVSLRTFERTWRRAEYWALVVLPPDQLPARADELSVLRAAAGLERAQRFADAGVAYTTILNRWPNSLGAAIGLGNARYAQSDLAGAEKVFRAAVARHPEAAPAWNNLAQVLAQNGRRDEALRAAREAVMRGGGAAAYQSTLDEITKSTN
jgi:hypothetical protein